MLWLALGFVNDYGFRNVTARVATGCYISILLTCAYILWRGREQASPESPS